MGDLTGALLSVQKSSRVRKQHFGHHLQNADSLFWQRLIHHCMNDHTSAVDAFQKAADINLNMLSDHKYTSLCYHNLGYAQCCLETIKKRSGAFRESDRHVIQSDW